MFVRTVQEWKGGVSIVISWGWLAVEPPCETVQPDDLDGILNIRFSVLLHGNDLTTTWE